MRIQAIRMQQFKELQRHFHKAAHPLGPIVIFSYGMTKCGSTLAFEMARTALELSGYPQPILPGDAIGDNNRINFARHLTEDQVEMLEYCVHDIGHPIIIKTHTRPDPCVIDMINRGAAIVHATYRDPREMALSMLDHGQKSRELGRKSFSELVTLNDALHNIRGQVDSLTQWLYRINCLPIFYQDLAFRMPLMTQRLMNYLMLDGDPKIIKQYVLKKRFIQFNKGIRNRYKEEMSPLDQRRIQQEFAPFFQHLIRNRMFLPSNGDPILSEGTVLFKS